jgi:hypothetical protein
MNPETGRSFDDIKALVEDIPALTAQDRSNIYENNARRCFPRLKAKGVAPTVKGDRNKYLTGEGARQGLGM